MITLKKKRKKKKACIYSKNTTESPSSLQTDPESCILFSLQFRQHQLLFVLQKSSVSPDRTKASPMVHKSRPSEKHAYSLPFGAVSTTPAAQRHCC